MRMSRFNDSGFTLIETMTVCAIIAIGTILAAPAYLQWHAKYQLRDAVTTIQSTLNLARLTAAKRNSSMNVQFSVSGGVVNIAVTDAAGSGVIAPVVLSGSVTAVSVTNSSGTPVTPGTVTFSSLAGLRTSGAATQPQLIRVTNNKGKIYSIAVTPGGQTRWCPSATCS